jgi:hypothetical protein
MSDTILGGDFTVYYLAETRQKRIVWTGSATGTRTVNQLYSALADLLDELNQMDDGSSLSAQTPTEYTIGVIDPSDKDPWFIDRTTVEHLYGGALKTSGWTRVTNTNTGIVRITYTIGTDFVTGDIGKTVTNAGGGDTGTLLDFANSGGVRYAWIRPTSSAAANDWDSTSGTITVTGGSAASVTQATAAVSGEMLWANIYNTGIATLVANTSQYVYQNGVKLTSYKGTFSWWPDGTFDILVPVTDMGTSIDGGFVTVFARQGNQTYAHFTSGLSAGGRNPIPLQTGTDLNNQFQGYRTFTSTSGTGTFAVGEIIYSPAAGALNAATKKGILTAVTGSPGSTPTLTYYLIGDLTDFVNTDTIKGNTSTATCTSAAPSDTALAGYSITVTHANDSTQDVDENGSNENYSIAIDLLGTRSVLEGYQYTQYLTRRGGTTTAKTDGIEGERYIGSDYRIGYTTLTGSIAEGTVVTGVTSGATGTVVAHHTGAKILVLRNSRGTFTNGEVVRRIASNEVSAAVPTAITPIGAAPFGIFAGGSWFCAPGIVLKNYLTGDVNKFQLTDDTGATRVAPTKVTVQVSNTRAADRVGVFRLTAAGGVINKTEYSGTVQSAGATTLVAGSPITSDTPGKSTGGVVRLVDVSAQTEFRLRYSSYASATFTLDTRTGLTADGGSSSTVLVDAAASFVTWGIKVGDLLRNTTESVIAYVVSVDSETQLTTTPIGNWNGDSYEINTLPVATTGSDFIYVPIIDSYETTGTGGAPGSESVSVTYLSNVPVLVRARKAGTILPFETEATITNAGMNVSVIRTSDPIFT